ncbi:MAG: type II toxin-antitoxin system VapC family toxin [Proteobacteria bacterium]|nr:type II toxin-antitoxin system VapC family toxin [Pseudomonadota bacterium]
MILPDVNVLVYAFRKDAENHQAYLQWLEDIVNSSSQYGLSDLALSGMLRIVTHPRVFNKPSSLDDSLEFIRQLRNQTNCLSIMPGNRHWEIFEELVQSVSASGNLIPDAWFAALAIEHGCEWITTDHDFSRFDGLNWRHPLR